MDPAPTASPYDSDTADATALSGALRAPARRELISPPGSPPEHAEAPTAAAGEAPSEGTGTGPAKVEVGDGWTVVHGVAAAHNLLETLQALLEYAWAEVLRAEDLTGPERLEGIPGPTRRKLVRFAGRRGAELKVGAMQLVRAVLPYIGLSNEPIGVLLDDGTVGGFSIIVTLPGAEPQPFHLDANAPHVHSVLIPLNPRRFRVASRTEPIELGAGDALAFKADELCHGGDGLGPDETMACALFVSVGLGVTEEVVAQSFRCAQTSLAQEARALTLRGLCAALGRLEDDTVGVVVAELHNRLLTDDTAQRPRLEAGAAVTVLHDLARVVTRAASAPTLAALAEGRWPLATAPTLLQSARLATAIASTLDRSTTGAEEQAVDVVLALAPVLRPMAGGAIQTVKGDDSAGKQRARPARISACDAIADLLEWARLALPSLATDVDGPLAPHVEYLLWKASCSCIANADREEALRRILDVMPELREALEREAAPRVVVAEREYLLLWKPEDSPEARALERRLAAAFQPGGIEREAAGRAILAQFMLLSPRLLSIGWHCMRAAAIAASSGGDEKEARRLGSAYGAVLRQARDEAARREATLKLARDEAARSAIEPVTDAPGWVDTTQEAIAGGLHVFAHMACKYDDEKRRGKRAAVFWEAFVAAAQAGKAAAQAGKAWTPLRSLSMAQQSAGARLDAMPWVLRRTPTAGPAHGAAQAQLPEGPSSGASSEQAKAEQERLRAAARRRAEARQRREERWAERALGGRAGGVARSLWRPPAPES